MTTIGSEPQTFNFSCAELFGPGVRLPWKLVKSFAQSPACASYAREIQDISSAQATASSRIPTPVLPVGVENGDAHIPFECCGGCELYVPEIQVLYWSTTSQIACSQPNATMTSDAVLPFSSNEAQRPTDSSQSDLATYTVLDGSTLTFPSTYLVIRGTLSVSNRCDDIGKIYTNPTIAVPQGGLSTLSFGSTYIGYAGMNPQTGSFDPAACHTYGISNASTSSWLYDGDGDGTSSWSSTAIYTFGPPYNPILLPPPQLTALDPEWQACTSWRTFGADAYAGYLGLIYDPPRALTREPAMVDPSLTQPDPAPRPTQSSPQPAGSISPAAPRLTDKPTNIANSGLTKDPSPDPVQPDNKPTLNTGPETKSPDPMIPGEDPTVAADPNPPEDRSDPMPSDTGLAGFILQPFQPIDNIVGDNPDDKDPATKTHTISLDSSGPDPPILTIDGSSYIANKASEYIVGSQTLSAGGPAIQVSGVLYSLASPTTTLPNIASIISALSSNDEPILTIDGKPYTADSASQYIVGSQTLAPGGPTITVNKVPYVLPASSAAIISGGSTIALDHKTAADTALLSLLSAVDFDTNHQPQTYTVDGIQMTGGPNNLAVASEKLAPGSPAITISGHTLSLANGGALVVDGHTSILNAPGFFGSNRPYPYQTYTVDGLPMTGNAAALVVGSTTLAAGSPALPLSGHVVSLATGGTLIVDGRTSVLISSEVSSLDAGAVIPSASTTGADSGSGNGNGNVVYTGGANRASLNAVRMLAFVLGGTVLVGYLPTYLIYFFVSG